MNAMFHATEIVKKLTREGYIAYFAGGWVRDFLMKHPSSDIDIATNAPPQVVLDLFPRTILVGLAFGVVIVVVDGHQFEVSTFRRDIAYLDGRKPERIELSSPEEDAKRRDFTINGMFYDPLEDKIHDYVHGMEDLKKGIIRTIGDPQERFLEDRLRMIRAIRFSCRFGFLIDQDTQQGIIENAEALFPAVALERVWQELNKMAAAPRFDHALIEMHRFGLLPVIFPLLKSTHLNDIKKRVVVFNHFPPAVPTILFLVHLFPETSFEDLAEICQYLRTSNRDIELVGFFLDAQKMTTDESASNDVDWTHFYANENAQICLKVIAAHRPLEDRQSFLKNHQQQRERLKKHVERIIQHAPLITGKMLRELGIPESKQLGDLVREAENIAILQNIDSSEVLLEALKKSPTWARNL